MRCRYCEKELATQADYDEIPEGEGEHLCWADFGQPCIDAEEALTIARARIAELEASIANASPGLKHSKHSEPTALGVWLVEAFDHSTWTHLDPWCCFTQEEAETAAKTIMRDKDLSARTRYIPFRSPNARSRALLEKDG